MLKGDGRDLFGKRANVASTEHQEAPIKRVKRYNFEREKGKRSLEDEKNGRTVKRCGKKGATFFSS